MEYVKLSREILNWEWYGNINTCRLFIHMILKANWKESKFEGTTVPRGSFVSSIVKLAEETQLTTDEVRTAIKHLICTKEITKQSYSKYTVFTVNNYDSYQNVPSKSPSSSQAIPKLFPTIEEREEVKNNILPPLSPRDSFNDFLRAYPKKVHTLKANEAYLKTLFDDQGLDEGDLVKTASNYAEAVKILETQERYILNPENFLLKGAYVDYLPANYKKPQAKKQTGFNQMMRNEYNFDELEKQMLGVK